MQTSECALSRGGSGAHSKERRRRRRQLLPSILSTALEPLSLTEPRPSSLLAPRELTIDCICLALFYSNNFQTGVHARPTLQLSINSNLSLSLSQNCPSPLDLNPNRVYCARARKCVFHIEPIQTTMTGVALLADSLARPRSTISCS